MPVPGDIERMDCGPCKAETSHTFVEGGHVLLPTKGWRCTRCKNFIEVWKRDILMESVLKAHSPDSGPGPRKGARQKEEPPRPTLVYSRRETG